MCLVFPWLWKTTSSSMTLFQTSKSKQKLWLFMPRWAAFTFTSIERTSGQLSCVQNKCCPCFLKLLVGTYSKVIYILESAKKGLLQFVQNNFCSLLFLKRWNTLEYFMKKYYKWTRIYNLFIMWMMSNQILTASSSMTLF